MTMKLYFVAHFNGDSYDLFVVANTVEEVETVWRDHYNVEGAPEVIFEVAGAAPTTARETPHALEWHGVNLPRVGGYRPANPR